MFFGTSCRHHDEYSKNSFILWGRQLYPRHKYFTVRYLLQVIQGNTNTYLEAKREVDPPVKASKVRILPYSYHRRTVCMRVEIYGCYWKGKKHQPFGLYI